MLFGSYKSKDGRILQSLNQIDCKDFENVKKLKKLLLYLKDSLI